MKLLLLFITIIIAFLYFIKKHDTLPRKNIPSYLIAFGAVFITVSLVRFPQDAFEASLQGLEIWWHIVFPALLPFFIFSQILIGLGVVHFMGVLLEPIMRPLFNVPGTGSFVMAMGLASGFPIGAILTSNLRQENLCNKVEAERLLSVSNTADPLYMFGAVAVGMFGYPEIGITIALAHYLSTISLGFIMCFYNRRAKPSPQLERETGIIIIRALNALVQAREKDGRSIGQLMGDAITKSMSTLLLIGGFIMLFSVIIRVLDIVGIVGLINTIISPALKYIGINPGITPALISGFFEIDLGCQMAGLSSVDTSIKDTVTAASVIIAWSGLSVHAQVASIISNTDISIVPYIIARCIHAILAGIYTTLLMGTFAPTIKGLVVPVFLNTMPISNLNFWFFRTYFMLNFTFRLLLMLSIFVMIISVISKIKTIYRIFL